MTRGRLVGVLLTVVVVAMGAYIVTNTYWDEIAVPTPPKGEAVSNPFYAAQRFAEALGNRTRRDRSLVLPPPGAVMVLSAWHWDLTIERQTALQRWVESGGRLVVDSMLTGDLTQFERWSGIEHDVNEAAARAHRDDHDDHDHDRCTPVEEAEPATGASFSVCDLDWSFTYLKSARPPVWALRNSTGNQALRVAVGKGTVTAINTAPFTWRSILEADHGRLFVVATQLTPGDEIVFLTEDDHPSLLALLWQYGSPAVGLFLAVVMLFLWRGAVRFGPLAALPEPRRRSMAEQIRGSGRFALEQGDGSALHAAAVRALHEAARRRIPAYTRLSRTQRAAALGRATGIDGTALTAAIDGARRRAAELPNTLGLIESARRHLLDPGS